MPGPATSDPEGQLSDPIEPDAARQREKHERQDFHRGQPTRLGRRRAKKHGGGERQREHRDLIAERADQGRAPQPTVGRVVQQIGRGQRETAPQLQWPLKDDAQLLTTISCGSLR